MIDREKINKLLDAMELLAEEKVSLTIENDGDIGFSVYPKNWWTDGEKWDDAKRHKVLGLVTPFVGKMEKRLNGTDIGYTGQKDHLTIRLNYVDQCKIVGYKTVTKKVQKEIEKPVEFEEVEETTQIPITDCEIRQGKFSESDIEIPA